MLGDANVPESGAMASEAQRARQARYRERHRARLNAREAERQAEIRAGERVERGRALRQRRLAEAAREAEALKLKYEGDTAAMFADWDRPLWRPKPKPAGRRGSGGRKSD